MPTSHGHSTRAVTVSFMIFLITLTLYVLGDRSSSLPGSNSSLRPRPTGTATVVRAANGSDSPRHNSAVELYSRSQNNGFANGVNGLGDDGSGEESNPAGNDNDGSSSDGGFVDDNDWDDTKYHHYVRKGGLSFENMGSSDDDVLHSLVGEGKLGLGEPLASRFTDVWQLRPNGWTIQDLTDRVSLGSEWEEKVPVRVALASLDMSYDTVLRGGRFKYWQYEPTLPWYWHGQQMQPVGSDATYAFATSPEEGCLIFSYYTGPQAVIAEQDLGAQGILPPPLKHGSDVAFIDWKRACDTYHIDTRTLKRIFVPASQTITTKHIVAEVCASQGHPLPLTGNPGLYDMSHLPVWERRLRFDASTDEGKALMGTPDLQMVSWMLLQHRAGLGKKTVREIYLFRDSDRAVNLPSFYLVLEDVPAPTRPPANGHSRTNGHSRPYPPRITID